MRDCQKRCQPNRTDSVMATLMRLDELLPQQPSRQKHRVLSESYISKASCVGLHRGRLVPTGRSSSTNKDDSILDKCANSSSRSPKPAVASALNPSFGKKRERCDARNPLRYLQKIELDLVAGRLGEVGINHTNKSLKFDLDMIYKSCLFSTSISGLKRKSDESTYEIQDVKSQRHSCIVCTRAMSRTSKKCRSKFEELTGQVYMGDSYIANEVRIPETRQNLDGTLADKDSMPKNLSVKTGIDDLSSLPSNSDNNLKKQIISQRDILEPRDGKCCEQSQTSLDVNDSSKISELSSCYSSPCHSGHNKSEAYAHGVLDNFSENAFDIEASLNEFSEEDSAYSISSMISPPAFQNPKRTNQRSPNSVLESFDKRSSSTLEFDCIGLRLQLQALNYEREETYSEESVMVVSDDEDSEERFGDLSHDGRNVKRWLGDEQSRNFSYMVDVLDEAGCGGMKSFVDFKAWNSLEFPISPSVFEELEKKYSKQTSWQKCERRLLFDFINSGLMGIFDFDERAKSVKRKLSDALRRDEVEDELWMMLISHEKEKSKNLNEKAVGLWSAYEEGMNIICCEIETALFDELVMELF